MIGRVLTFVKSGWPDGELEDDRLRPFASKSTELTTEQDCILWGMRVGVPNLNELREAVLAEFHVAHPGVVRMKNVGRSHVWWPNIESDIESTVRQCTPCQANISQPSVAPLMLWMWPGKPWYRVHMDYAEKEGHSFLVIADAHSKWPEITPTKSTAASTAIDVARKTFARFGPPEQVVTDNGPQFASAEFAEFLPVNAGCEAHSCCTVSPGKRRRGRVHGANVQAQFAGVCWRRSSSSRATRRFSAEVSNSTFRDCNVAGKPDLRHECCTRLTLLRPSLKSKVLEKQSAQVSGEWREFYASERVMARNIRSQRWLFSVIAERNSPKSYVAQLDDGRVWKRHVDHPRRSEVDVEKTPPPDIAVTPQARTPECQPQALHVREEVLAAASFTETQVQEEHVRREEDGQKEKVCKETVTTELRRSTRTTRSRSD